MSKKEILKQYIHQYGEIEVLDDIANMLQEFSQEWKISGDKYLWHVFSDTANLISEASNKLKIAERYYQNNEQNDFNAQINKEFNLLNNLYKTMSLRELIHLYFTDRNQLLLKLKRLLFLKKYLNKK